MHRFMHVRVVGKEGEGRKLDHGSKGGREREGQRSRNGLSGDELQTTANNWRWIRGEEISDLQDAGCGERCKKETWAILIGMSLPRSGDGFSEAHQETSTLPMSIHPYCVCSLPSLFAAVFCSRRPTSPPKRKITRSTVPPKRDWCPSCGSWGTKVMAATLRYNSKHHGLSSSRCNGSNICTRNVLHLLNPAQQPQNAPLSPPNPVGVGEVIDPIV